MDNLISIKKKINSRNNCWMIMIMLQILAYYQLIKIIVKIKIKKNAKIVIKYYHLNLNASVKKLLRNIILFN